MESRGRIKPEMRERATMTVKRCKPEYLKLGSDAPVFDNSSKKQEVEVQTLISSVPKNKRETVKEKTSSNGLDSNRLKGMTTTPTPKQKIEDTGSIGQYKTKSDQRKINDDVRSSGTSHDQNSTSGKGNDESSVISNHQKSSVNSDNNRGSDRRSSASNGNKSGSDKKSTSQNGENKSAEFENDHKSTHDSDLNQGSVARSDTKSVTSDNASARSADKSVQSEKENRDNGTQPSTITRISSQSYITAYDPLNSFHDDSYIGYDSDKKSMSESENNQDVKTGSDQKLIPENSDNQSTEIGKDQKSTPKIRSSHGSDVLSNKKSDNADIQRAEAGSIDKSTQSQIDMKNNGTQSSIVIRRSSQSLSTADDPLNSFHDDSYIDYDGDKKSMSGNDDNVRSSGSKSTSLKSNGQETQIGSDEKLTNENGEIQGDDEDSFDKKSLSENGIQEVKAPNFDKSSESQKEKDMKDVGSQSSPQRRGTSLKSNGQESQIGSDEKLTNENGEIQGDSDKILTSENGDDKGSFDKKSMSENGIQEVKAPNSDKSSESQKKKDVKDVGSQSSPQRRGTLVDDILSSPGGSNTNMGDQLAPAIQTFDMGSDKTADTQSDQGTLDSDMPGSDRKSSTGSGDKQSSDISNGRASSEKQKDQTTPSDPINMVNSNQIPEEDESDDSLTSEDLEPIVIDSPWGEPHRKIVIPPDFFYRKKQSYTVNDHSEVGDDCIIVNEKSKISGEPRRYAFRRVSHKPSPPPVFNLCPCCGQPPPTVICNCIKPSSSPAVCPNHPNSPSNVICSCPHACSPSQGPLVYDVCPVFPVYLVNSIESSHAQTRSSSPNRTPYGVNIVNLPTVELVSESQRRSAGLSSNDRWSQRERANADLNNLSSTKKSSLEKPLGQRPPTIICYICGREYGTASIGIHEKQCLEKWRKENSQLPKNMQRPEPVKPQVFNHLGSSSGTADKISGSGKSNYDIDSLNAAAFESAQAQYDKCSKCGRTFLPDRLKIHTKNCRGFHKIALGKREE